MGLKKALIRIVLNILQTQVIAVVNAQINLIGEQVRNVMQRYVQEVVGGMWRGDGATRFVDEIMEDAIPALDRAVEIVRGTNRNIEVARDTMQDADTRVKGAVGRIVNAFEQI